MGAFAIDLAATSGFLVADRNGEVVGRVECQMYGTAPNEPDALACYSNRSPNRQHIASAALLAGHESTGRGGVPRAANFFDRVPSET